MKTLFVPFPTKHLIDSAVFASQVSETHWTMSLDDNIEVMTVKLGIEDNLAPYATVRTDDTEGMAELLLLTAREADTEFFASVLDKVTLDRVNIREAIMRTMREAGNVQLVPA